MQSAIQQVWGSAPKNNNSDFGEIYLYRTLNRLANCAHNPDLYVSDLVGRVFWYGHLDATEFNAPRYNLTHAYPHRTLFLTSTPVSYGVFCESWQSTSYVFTVIDYFSWERVPFPRIATKMPQMTVASYTAYSNNPKNITLIIAASNDVDTPAIASYRQSLNDYLTHESRKDVIVFQFLRHVHVRRLREKVDEIVSLYRVSHFGIVPAGDTPTSTRFYDLLKTATIPIIMSDHFTAPFESLFFDLSTICVQFPMNELDLIWKGVNLITSWKEQSLRRSILDMRYLYDLVTDDKSKIRLGHQEWAHLWQFTFILCTKSMSERRQLVESFI